MSNVVVALRNQIGEGRVLVDEPMYKHTSFKTGGPVDFLIKPQTREHLIGAIELLRANEIPYIIMGNCSNVLVSDKGIRGAVIQIYSNMCHVKCQDDMIEAKAGALLTVIAANAMEHGLTGFEFASGIPGTLGGAITMNAGAYGGEMKDVLVSIDVLTKDLEIRTIPAEELQLSYRYSVIPERDYIILSGKIRLKNGDKKEIKERMTALATQRREKQPLNYPSAGSTFKRPEGYFAGKLISDAGLKGYTIGGAQVSEKHAGFIINLGGATSKNILDLIQHCQKTVFDKFGVALETEVKIVGEI